MIPKEEEWCEKHDYVYIEFCEKCFPSKKIDPGEFKKFLEGLDE